MKPFYFLLLSVLTLGSAPSAHGETVFDRNHHHKNSRVNIECPEFQLIKQFILPFKNRRHYPVIDGDIVENQPSSNAIPSLIKKEFEAIQLFVFGRQLLTLESCASCELQTDSNRKIVFVNPEFVRNLYERSNERDSERIIRFALAHEISHYLYEVGIKDSKMNRSLLGHKSLFRGSVSELFIDDGLIPLFQAHAEVDYYAEVILTEMGHDDFLDLVIENFSQLERDLKLKGEELASQHFGIRVQWLIGSANPSCRSH